MDAGTETGERKETGLEAFLRMAGEYDHIPIFLEKPLGKRNPLDMYRVLRKQGVPSFLLESGSREGHGNRYSFIGTDPDRIFDVSRKGCMEIEPGGRLPPVFHPSRDGLRRAFDGYLSGRRPPREEGFPPFTGGIAGYFGYDMVETWEDLFHGASRRPLRDSPFPRALLMGFPTVIAVDHASERLWIVSNARFPLGGDAKSGEDLYRETISRMEHLEDLLELPEKKRPGEKGAYFLTGAKSNMDKESFLDMVHRARNHIVAGDICQVVLSQKFSAGTNLPPLDIYEALRAVNPSPYLFFLELPEFRLIGSSPEVLVRLRGERVVTRPLAGTRRRGFTEEEDLELERELLEDGKERAEHLMLVDLARNDLGRVCRTGTVKVTQFMGVERYSRVMHIVSQVEGDRNPGLHALDVIESAFPAGTVSGAPKIRAMEIIEDLEKSPRGPYAGAVGYIGFDGDMDTCIAIRTFLQKGEEIQVQAGAGIVFDSVPEREYEETVNKAGALFSALQTALRRNRHDTHDRQL